VAAKPKPADLAEAARLLREVIRLAENGDLAADLPQA
jgi:hypothetical protein